VRRSLAGKRNGALHSRTKKLEREKKGGRDREAIKSYKGAQTLLSLRSFSEKVKNIAETLKVNQGGNSATDWEKGVGGL